ncbi:MAG TPA: HD domain-containing phosphohydrolase, partial [Oscillatoriaceae cyanobacterium]
EPALYRSSTRLSQSECFRIWEHAVRGARRALELTGSQAVSQWVRWHHERWDGLGYPDGLVGEQIPLPARILRLADGADALLHERPYRAAMTGEETLAELNRLSAVVSDPALTRIFVDDVLPAYLADQGGLWRKPSESPSGS